MAFWPLTIEIIVTFLLSSYLLNRFGNWLDQNIVTTVSVFISWFFSFLVIFILPLDISTTTYLQCLNDHDMRNVSHLNVFEDTMDVMNVSNITTTPLPPNMDNPCLEPWSYAPNQVLPTLWRIVYWTSQMLTWIVLPLMQSYCMAGEFSIGGKLKAAFIENAIYYGIFSVIFVIFLIYVSIKTQLNFEGIKIICTTASNTWGLFLLVVLLGYGLVEIPRSCFNVSHYGRSLNYLYFKVAKLSAEKCESDEKLDDVLDEIQTCLESLRGDHDPMRPYLDIIVDKCPLDWRHQMMNRLAQTSAQSVSYSGNTFNEKTLTRMHKNIIQAMQTNHRTHCKWNVLITDSIECEDISKNEINVNRHFRPTIESRPKSALTMFIKTSIYTPRVEWYWKCCVRSPFYRLLGYCLTILSLMVIWSEMTFSIQSIPLSIFALIMDSLRNNYNYFFVESFSILVIAYLCVCAYYTVFKIRIFNYYYLSAHHQTDEYSLIFCGMLLCRLAPPLCLNYLGLIHLDSHITHKVMKEETAFTKIMGHLDVISFIGDSFAIYLPLCICLFCLATFFEFGAKLLHNLGFEQFILTDEMTTELIREGQELVKREKNKILRQLEPNSTQTLRFKKDPPIGGHQQHQQPISPEQMISRDNSEDNMRQELIRESEPIGYSTNWSYNSTARPPKGLFDDI
ncbi:G-protein coupled receptor-associated protein LMBRD2-like [Oppia nitens]|uniref:G-protein coupled receptor-associated protein LMBRD2-like n=1 Tax=Oppia nitens TaxID=1686743 RepID=UPI0023DAA5AA|nr:G-protein coupled receptor-associated protein LMBRD2-like [Oppia nitens]